MYKIVKQSDARVRDIFPNYSATNFITNDISPDVSLAITDATDFEDTTTTKENRIYYLLEGSLELIIDGSEVRLEPGDSCFISENITYTMKGTFKSVVVNSPAFGVQK